MSNQAINEKPQFSPFRVLPLAFKGQEFTVGARFADSVWPESAPSQEPPTTDLADERIARILAEPLPSVDLLPARLITTPDDLAALDTSAVDCLLVMVVAGESQALIRFLARFDDMPMVFYGADEALSHTLFSGYGAVRSPKTSTALDADDVRRQLRVQAVLKRLRQSTIMQIGDVSDSVVDNPADLESLKRVFGVKIDSVDVRRLLERVAQVDATLAKRRADALETNATQIDGIDSQDIYESAAQSLAAQELAQELGFDAMAIDCTGVFDAGGVAPCVALHDYEALGIPAACEGDLTALVAKMILTYLTGEPTFMGNLGPFDGARDSFFIWHHTSPTSMFMNGEYSLASYAGHGVKLISQVQASTPVTVVKIGRKLENATVLEGTVLSSALSRGCLDMEIQIPDLRRFANEHILGNHHVVALGNHGQEVAAVLEALGIETFVMRK